MSDHPMTPSPFREALDALDIDGLRSAKAAAEDRIIDLTEPGYRWTTSPHGKAFWDAVDEYADLRWALREATDGAQ